jgi:exoribonuclease R
MVELDKTLKGVNEAKKKVITMEKSKQISDLWEAQYTKDKAGREKAKQDAADAAQAKADMLFQEFLDPTKRTSRLDEEKRKADAEAQLQREYADIQRRQETGFGIRNPNDREKQVMELMNARQEVTRTQEAVQKDIEKNTRRIAEAIESLGNMPPGA